MFQIWTRERTNEQPCTCAHGSWSEVGKQNVSSTVECSFRQFTTISGRTSDRAKISKRARYRPWYMWLNFSETHNLFHLIHWAVPASLEPNLLVPGTFSSRLNTSSCIYKQVEAGSRYDPRRWCTWGYSNLTNDSLFQLPALICSVAQNRISIVQAILVH